MGTFSACNITVTIVNTFLFNFNLFCDGFRSLDANGVSVTDVPALVTEDFKRCLYLYKIQFSFCNDNKSLEAMFLGDSL